MAIRDRFKFCVNSKGWITASELTAGDILRTQNGEGQTVVCVSTEKLEEPVKVYNLEVEEEHIYYVTEGNVLVHNMCKVKDGNGDQYNDEGGSRTVSKSDRIKIDGWDYTPTDDLYLKYKDIYDNPLYYDQITGKIHWPAEDGFKVGSKIEREIPQNIIFKRYGENSGEFWVMLQIHLS